MRVEEGFTFSLIVHGVLIGALSLVDVSKRGGGGPILIDLVEQPTRQKVRVPFTALQDLKPDPTIPPPSEVENRLVGARTLRVSEERQASLRGQNTFGSGGEKSANLAPSVQKSGDQATRLEQDGDMTVPSVDRPRRLELPMGRGVSTLREVVPGITLGDVNFLNVDHLTYYTFFVRFENALVPRWNRTLRDALNRIDHKVFFRNDRWTTIIDMELDPKGELTQLKLVRTSGLDPVDSAILEALRETAPLNNPPMELVQDNGRIRLRLAATVYTRPVY